MSSNQDNKGKGGGGPRRRGFFIGAILWALILVIFFNFLANQIANAGTQEVPYSEFIEMVEQDKVATAELTANQITFYLKEDLPAGVEGSTAEPSQDLAQVLTQQMEQGGATRYVTAPVAIGEGDTDLIPLLKEHNVTYFSPMQEESSYLVTLLLSYVVPMILMVALLVFLMRRLGGGMGGLGGVGKSNAKVYMEKSTGVTFADVAGQDEAKESLEEIIDFLHNPGKYTEIGAKLPKGALLVGPPGTGKTLLAKAVAGEANVPFFSISGSDFVEMFVGVGASRVRDLFKEANKVAPCIVFIDEIDTIGKSRDNRMGGNDEREQTLNQLLAEMDGFDPTKGVILLAATNRPEVLDQALLRPGRFDRRITIDRPNLAGRLATLQVHTRRIRLAEDVDLKKVALATAGCVGADLANLVNEAALRAVRLGRRAVKQEDLLAAFELVIAGTEKKGSVLTEFEKKLVAYHEVGHAMVAYKQKNTEPVQKITIVPHTQGSLGYTLLMPEEDKTELRTKDELMARITVSMGGRAAEEVVLHTMTNGASQDIQDATAVARNMVAMFGMSEEFGMMALASRRSQFLDGGYGMDCAQDTAARMDQAVKALLDTCYQQAVGIIRDNREDMDKVVAYLLEKETITGAEMVAIIEGRDPATADSPYLTEGPSQTPPAPPSENQPPLPPAGEAAAPQPPVPPAGGGEDPPAPRWAGALCRTGPTQGITPTNPRLWRGFLFQRGGRPMKPLSDVPQPGQRTLLIPAMLDDHFPLLQYAFHSRDYFPVILDQGQGAAELGLRYAHNDMCYPLPPEPGAVPPGPGQRGLRTGEHRPADAHGGGRLPGVQFYQPHPQGPGPGGVPPGEGPHPERQGAGEGPGPAYPPPHGVAGPLRPVLRGPAPLSHPPDPALGGRPRGGGGLPGPVDRPAGGGAENRPGPHPGADAPGLCPGGGGLCQNSPAAGPPAAGGPGGGAVHQVLRPGQLGHGGLPGGGGVGGGGERLLLVPPLLRQQSDRRRRPRPGGVAGASAAGWRGSSRTCAGPWQTTGFSPCPPSPPSSGRRQPGSARTSRWPTAGSSGRRRRPGSGRAVPGCWPCSPSAACPTMCAAGGSMPPWSAGWGRASW